MRIMQVKVKEPVVDYPHVFFIPPLFEHDFLHNERHAVRGELPNGRRFDGSPHVPAWCEDQFGPEGEPWVITQSACHIAFRSPVHAAAFKMRWCGPA